MEHNRTDLNMMNIYKVLGFCEKGWMQSIVNTYKVIRLPQMINIECDAPIYMYCFIDNINF
jgi:hypothetical protein